MNQEVPKITPIESLQSIKEFLLELGHAAIIAVTSFGTVEEDK